MRKPYRRGRASLAASRALLSWASALLFGLLLWLSPRNAEAYPWMIRHGYTNCGACHADPSGGELLTPYGHGISYEVLSTRFGGSEKSAQRFEQRVAKAVSRAAGAKSAPPDKKSDADADADTAGDDSGKEKAAPKKQDAESKADADAAEEESAEEEQPAESANATEQSSAASASVGASTEESPYKDMNPITGPLFGLLKPNEDFLLGGSLRFASIYKFQAPSDKFRFFPMQADAYGQIRFARRIRIAGSLGLTKVPAGSPHGRRAQITTNQGDGYNAISRTHYIGYEFGDGAHLIRAGRINLPFGVRIPEHTMWVRERTQTDRETDQQHGVALYMGWDTVRFELMAIAGNYQINPDRFRERGYSGYIEWMADPKVAVGASSLLTVAKDDYQLPTGESTTRQAHGLLLRAAATEALSFLAEADVLLRSRREAGYVGFLQADIEPIQGFHVTGTGELFDAGLPKGGGVARAAGLGRPQGGGWFTLQWFFMPHFDVRADLIRRTDTQLLAQLHVYL